MKIPKTLRIGGSVYKVRVRPGHIMIGEQKCDGICDKGNHIIELNGTLPKDALEQTFLHEVVHALSDYMNIDWDEADETYTECLSKGFHALIVQNKGVFE